MSARTVIVGTAGHIDHGKTALVRALTGIDCDRLPAEKERGITIDIGFANLTLGDVQIGIVDVPGHERFVRNMLAGASGIDIAMLVVAADDSVMPQTREHLAILNLLQIRHGIIALTKCDLVESAWLDLVEDDIRELVKDSFLEHAPIVRTSAQTSTGFDELKASLKQCCERVGARSESAQFRLPIDRSFVGQGIGTVVTGTVWSGRLEVGQTLQWLPRGEKVKVRTIQSHGSDVAHVSAGQRAAINLIGAHHSDVHRGQELVQGDWLTPARLMTAELRCVSESPLPVRHRARVRLHLGTQEILAGVRMLDTSRSEIAPGDVAFAQLILAEPGIAAPRQPFVLRAESPLVTIGGGVVLQPAAAVIRRGDSHAIGLLGGFLHHEPLERLASALYFSRVDSQSTDSLARIAKITPTDVPDAFRALCEDQRVVPLQINGGTVHIHTQRLAELRERIIKQMSRFHQKFPLEPLMPRGRLISALEWLGGAALLNAVMDYLIERGDLKGDAKGVAGSTFEPKLTDRQRRLHEQILARFAAAAFKPPDVPDLAAELGMKDAEVRAIVELCVNAGAIIHLGGGVFLGSDHEREMRTRVTTRLEATSGLAVSEMRDLLETSRKFAVPFCEYLDQIGVTKRVGDVRVLASLT